MGYGKRNYRRRSQKSRARRTLSTRNIFNNKTAKAQAYQISALKKRISAVSRRCAPEVKVSESNINQYTFNTIPQAAKYRQALIHPLKTPAQATGSLTDGNRIGDKVNVLPTNLFLSLQYEEIYNSMNSGLSNIKFELPTSAIQARIVVVQQKVADGVNPSYNDIFEHQNVYDEDAPANPLSALMMMKSPFKTGITSRYHILMDRHITLSRDYGQKAVRFSVKPKMKSLRWYGDAQTGTGTSPAGQLWMFVLTSGWSSKQWNVEGSAPIYDYNQLNLQYRTRTPFTDA